MSSVLRQATPAPPTSFDADIAWITLADLAESFLARLPFLVIGLIVFVLFVIAGQIAKHALLATARRTRLNLTLADLLGRLVSAGFIIFGLFVWAVVIFPAFKPGDLVAGLGITSIAIGFAFRDILQNFLAGVLILWRQPFRVGDQIRTGAYEGTVVEVNTRSTRLQTYDGELVVVPNSDVYTGAVLVRTAYQTRRIRFTVPIGYPDSIEKARETIHRVLANTEGVHAEPAPWVHVSELAASSVNLTVYFWTDARQAEVLQTSNRVATGIKQALDQAHIDMPYPHTVVMLHDGDRGPVSDDKDVETRRAAP
jgi:small conductance mechanosensitive channel